ncbi:MAG: hypothetical protein QOJ09_156 [Actinomycetota bacterium]|nr:hypothetical protein [Actinomycetota bacterium]
MTSIRELEQSVDSGYLAVLGHSLLGSVSVVSGALETLRRDGDVISASNRVLLENAIERNLGYVTDAARALVHGDGLPT